MWAAAVEDSEERPQGVRVTAASPWVPGMSLVDTPGIGGMQASHLLAARAAAESGTAVLFVADGAQPLSAPELAFLAEMSEQTERVVLALTKIDRNPGAWEEVRVDNVRLLKVHAPRLARQTFHATSAAYALHALQQPDDVAAALNLASGIPALAEELRHVAAGSGALAPGNTRVGQHGLGMLEQNIGGKPHSSPEPTSRPQTSDRRRDPVGRARQRQRCSKSYLERDVNRIRSEAIDAINRGADRRRRDADPGASPPSGARPPTTPRRSSPTSSTPTELAETVAADLQEPSPDGSGGAPDRLSGPLGVRADDPAGRVAAPTFKTRVAVRHTLEGPGGLGPVCRVRPRGWKRIFWPSSASEGYRVSYRRRRDCRHERPVPVLRAGQYALLGTRTTPSPARGTTSWLRSTLLRRLRPNFSLPFGSPARRRATQAQDLDRASRARPAAGRRSSAVRAEQLMLRRDALRAKRLAVERIGCSNSTPRRAPRRRLSEHSAPRTAPPATTTQEGTYD